MKKQLVASTAKPFTTNLSLADLQIVKGADGSPGNAPPPPSIDWTRTGYGGGVVAGPRNGVDTRDCD